MISSKIYPLLIMGVLLLFASSCSKNNDKDDSGSGSSTEVTFGSMTDQDNNTFKTVTIGTQTWMAENLKVTHYNDGTAIPNITGTSAWGNLYHSGAYCCYDNNNNYLSTYGLLYNWSAVNTGKLAPKGWHVPTSDEWTTLSTYISTHQGTSGSEAKALAATSSWLPSTDVNVIGNDLMKNNSSGFTALPGGYRIPASFYCIGSKGFWWSSTEFSSGGAYIRFLTSGDKEMCGADFNWEEKEYGLSVRCVKD